MNIHHLHSWNLAPKAAMQLQRELAHRVVATGALPDVRIVAGADLASVSEVAAPRRA